MENHNVVFERERMELEAVERAAREDLKHAPRGSLCILKNNQTDQYYWRIHPQDTEGKYIRKCEEKLIQGLAQKDYANKVLTVLESYMQKQEKEFQKADIWGQIAEIYENLSTARKKLVTPYVESKSM